ncbi:MAG: hypothetical protein IT328_06150 [Caldilineaceae bacterium]|nr:hypothetical protein [Caldilineaceae bacterium]
MSTTHLNNPTSRLRFGLARMNITPPVGIYHRLWGAARHDRATGVHRPLTCEVMAFGALGDAPGTPPHHLRAVLDLPGLVEAQHEELVRVLAESCGVPHSQVVISFSHTHSSGWFVPDRFNLPGGELIPGYLRDLNEKGRQAGEQAVAAMQEVSISYAKGQSNMAGNRDYWDAERGLYACGFNPDAPADDTVMVARVTNAAGELAAVIVNYACHPTTLAWDNSLISPDYVGALRETVEQATGVTSVFLQGACGDLGPRHGFVGDTAVADSNGRQVGFAALSALESIDPPLSDFAYTGPVVSGATLGTWAPTPLSDARLAATATLAGACHHVDLPIRERPDRAQLERDLAEWNAKSDAAAAQGDLQAAGDARAYAERARRWIARLDDLPPGDTFPVQFSVHRLGDAIWISCGGEPYNLLQVDLRRRFPNHPLLISPISGDLQVAYLLPQDRYGKGLYQEEPSILAPGCLEGLIEAISAQVEALVR